MRYKHFDLIFLDCNVTLGLQNGFLPNSSMTSNSFGVGFEPWNARLNGPGAWCNEYKDGLGLLYIDLLQLTDVTGIATQGAVNISQSATTSIRIFHSLDKMLWRYYGYMGSTAKVLIKIIINF
jgi:hypothetical protein